MNKRFLLNILMTGFLVLFQGSIIANEHETQNNSEPQTEVTQPQESSTQGTDLPPDSFVPTETISEDLSVPFPVDI